MSLFVPLPLQCSIIYHDDRTFFCARAAVPVFSLFLLQYPAWFNVLPLTLTFRYCKA